MDFLSDAQIDGLGVVLFAVGIPLGIWLIYQYLRDIFFPNRRLPVPDSGKLTHEISPLLQAFVASLPRPAGDPLEALRPLARADIPVYGNNPRAVMPLWRSGTLLAFVRLTSRRGQSKLIEFVQVREDARDGRDDDVRAESEQGFLADTIIGIMQDGEGGEPMLIRERARRVSEVLGFKHLAETLAWCEEQQKLRANPGPADPYGDEELLTPAGRAEEERWSFVSKIDKRR